MIQNQQKKKDKRAAVAEADAEVVEAEVKVAEGEAEPAFELGFSRSTHAHDMRLHHDSGKSRDRQHDDVKQCDRFFPQGCSQRQK